MYYATADPIVDDYSSNDFLLTKLRSMVSKIMEIGEYKTASFWANKVLSFTNSDKNDVYQQSKCFFHLKEYHRAAHCIKSRNLHKTDLACRHLAAKCHVNLINPLIILQLTIVVFQL